MKFFCIGDEDTVRGFRLAGVEGRAVGTAKEAEAVLARALADGAVGVLVLTESVAAGIRGQVNRVRAERELPLVVEIPGPAGPAHGGGALRRLVREAVGAGIGREEEA